MKNNHIHKTIVIYLILLTYVSALVGCKSCLQEPKTPTAQGELITAIEQHRPIKELVEIIARRKPDLNSVAGTDNNFIHLAAEENYPDAIDLFIKCGIDINHHGILGYTPLHAGITKNSREAVERLLDLGADKEALNGIGASPLTLAAHKNRVDIVKMLVKKGAKIDRKVGEHGLTALHDAIKNDSYESAEALVSLGADVNVPCESKDLLGSAPIHYAIDKESTKFLKLLLDKGNPNKNLKSSSGVNLLSFAIFQEKYEMVEILLKYGLDPNESDDTGTNPFCLAIRSGNLSLIELFLKYGANPNVIQKNGSTLVEYCAANNLIEPLKLLMRWQGTNKVDLSSTKSIMRAVHIAARVDNLEIVKLLAPANLELQSLGKNYTILEEAVCADSLNTVKELISMGANTNPGNIAGGTLLNNTVAQRHYKTMEFLLQYGLDPNVLNKDDISPLAIAIGNHDLKSIEMLLKYGADPKKEFSPGCAAIHMAAEQGYIDLIELFAPGSLNLQASHTGNTALQEALKTGQWDVVKRLVSLGADTTIPDNTGNTSIINAILFDAPKEIVETLLDKLLSTKSEDDVWQTNETTTKLTLCSLAIKKNRLDILELFLGRGADIENYTDKCYEQPSLQQLSLLGYAVIEQRYEIIDYLLKRGANYKRPYADAPTFIHAAVKYKAMFGLALIKILCKYLKKEELNIRNYGGYTPIHYAVMNNNIDAVKFLIDQGADKNPKAEYDVTAIDWARDEKLFEIVNLLSSGNTKEEAKKDNNRIYKNREEVMEHFDQLKTEIESKIKSIATEMDKMLNSIKSSSFEQASAITSSAIVFLGEKISNCENLLRQGFLTPEDKDAINKTIEPLKKEREKAMIKDQVVVLAFKGKTIDGDYTSIGRVHDAATESDLNEKLSNCILFTNTGDLILIKYMLEFKGILPHIDDIIEYYGMTLLHNAVDRYEYDIVKYLLDKGAKVNVKDKYGRIPLESISSDIDMMEFGEKKAKAQAILALLKEHEAKQKNKMI